MRKLIFLPAFLLILAFTGSVPAQNSNSLTPEQKSWISKANRHEKDGWIYLHIEGEPFERGFQHGYLLAPEIRDAIVETRKIWEYDTDVDWTWLVDQCINLIADKIDEEDLAEIDGMVEGLTAANVSTSRGEMITYNDIIELEGSWWPTVKDSISPNAPEPQRQSCSSFIATGSMTADGKIVLGHNTWGIYYGPLPNIILDIVPARGQRIMMQAAAGLIHSGTDFFITGAGLIGSETTIGGFFPFDPKGIPEFVRLRRAMQDASSIEEWCEIMKQGNNGGYANAWLIGDIKTNEIARLELGLKCIGYEKKKEGYFTGSNIAEDPCILRKETKSKEMDIRGSGVARRVRWNQLMKLNNGKIDIEMGKKFLSDHFDPYLDTLSPCSRSLCGHGELDPHYAMPDVPAFYPGGAFDGKLVNNDLAKNMSFVARWGSSCGMAFDADKFLMDHPQYGWMKGLLKNRPSQKWTTFTAGEKK
jgi:hypothetical protein